MVLFDLEIEHVAVVVPGEDFSNRTVDVVVVEKDLAVMAVEFGRREVRAVFDGMVRIAIPTWFHIGKGITELRRKQADLPGQCLRCLSEPDAVPRDARVSGEHTIDDAP